MKHTRGRFVGNIVSSVGGWPGSASGVWNRNDALTATRGSTWPVYSSVPNAPAITGVVRVAGSGTSVDVSFTAPANNGNQTITSYTAVSTPGNVTASVSQAGSGTIRVTGLTQGTSYTFVVYATNVVGNSANSAASSAITPATVPGTPTVGSPTRVAGSGTQIDVPFSAPASNGGLAITSYTATSSPGNITGTISQAGSGTIRVTGLTQGTSYTFTVYATNPIGNGTASSASSAIAPAVAPAAPTIGTATAVTASSATVAFTAPADNGGAAITSYTATSSPGGLTGTLSQAGSGTITVTGLTKLTAYTFTVYATNPVGNSPNSAASNQITTPGDGPTTLDYLVVAGGGGSGVTQAGGGGGGGMLQGSRSVASGVTYTVTVGSGGAANANGGNSAFDNVVATGGGAGGAGGYAPEAQRTYNGSTGGSGGGGCGADNNTWTNGSGGAGTPGQGYAGGSGTGGGSAWGGGGGGGGGAGAAGQNGYNTRVGGSGGSGAQWTITGTYYAGGGGGDANCRDGTGSAGPGGTGGGGRGAGGCESSPGAAGTVNTGGGGGGGQAGGSGIVILRYASSAADGITTGSPTFTNSGGYKTYTFTGSGTIRW